MCIEFEGRERIIQGVLMIHKMVCEAVAVEKKRIMWLHVHVYMY